MSENTQLTETGKKKGWFPWYPFCRVCGNIVIHVVGFVRYHHKERLPQEGPAIIICNHTTWIDPIIIGTQIKPKEVTFMAKKELKGNRFFDIFFSGLHVIAVDRHNSDMEAMRACMRLLKKGEILGIFPEGTRHAGGNMQKLESGAALIALRANVPLIPVYVKPKFRVFRKADCYVGKPIDFSDLREEGINKDTCEALLDRIRNLYANWPED